MYLHDEMAKQMVAYHQERLQALMRGVDNDRAMLMKYRARLGSLLIAAGQRMRGRDAGEFFPSSSHPVAIPSHGECV